MVREATAGPLVAPTPELPEDMPIERVLFSTRIQNALRAADLKTVGEVRETSDETLISLAEKILDDKNTQAYDVVVTRGEGNSHQPDLYS